MNALEMSELARYEAVIQRGLGMFVETGQALLAIRDGKLYREFFGTFEEYCQAKWGMSRPQAYRLIGAAEVVTNLSPIGDILPAAESQIRPLTALEPDQQREAWAKVIEVAPDGKVTAALVQDVVDKMLWPDEDEDEDREEHYVIMDEAGTEETVTVGPDEELRVVKKKYKHVSDDSYEWYTPLNCLEAARAVMGGIDLDPASCVAAQQLVKAKRFYTKEEDGLAQDWRGKVWLNPPYCMPEIEQFVDQVIASHLAGQVTQAVVLTNNATDTVWFHRLLAYARLACFTKGRIKFYGPDGEVATGARQGQVFFYLGPNAAGFVEKFREFGTLVRLA